MISAVILAAGEGKRMKSKKAKVIHKALDQELIKWVLDAVEGAGVEDICVVVGHKEEQVKACLEDRVSYTTQKEQKGTGHALMMAEPFLAEKSGTLFVLYGDTPIITADTLQKLLKTHQEQGNVCTMITAMMTDPTGYGRIDRTKAGEFAAIVEHRDCSDDQLRIQECNAGMYCFEIDALKEVLHKLSCDNDQNEYYLTDVPGLFSEKGLSVGTYVLEDKNEMLGINDRLQLAEAEEILRNRYITYWMQEGVTFIRPDSCMVSSRAVIGRDTIVYPNCRIEGDTQIGEDCVIGPDSRLVNTQIGNETEINKSVVTDSQIGSHTQVGPFAYIRPGNVVGDHVKVGDFVELKKAQIGDGTKISHLTYVGDADVGVNCNIACGVVTVNYDGSKKYKTKIGDHCFIGCNVNLVSPVEIEEYSYVAAGSTITEDVPSKALAVARARQVNKEGWVEQKGRYHR